MCVPGENLSESYLMQVPSHRPIIAYRVVRVMGDGGYGPVWHNSNERFSPAVYGRSVVPPQTGNESGYHAFSTRRSAERYLYRRTRHRIARVLLWGQTVICRNKNGNKVGYRSEFMLVRAIVGATRKSGFEKLEASK